MASIIVALLSSRLGKLEKDVEGASKAIHDLSLQTTADHGLLQWLKASLEERRDDYLPRELALQRLEQQDHQLARIEAALERKISVTAMSAVRDPRRDSEPPPPPYRGKLPSRGGR